ncbi:MAG: hypothetical protein FJW86_03690 [Actinobacteria bacterium]|nr:hypothetical protein [Actinomycetota bacterium]
MSAHFVKGTDPILRDEAVSALVETLLDGEDRSFALEDFTIPADAKAADDDDTDEDGEIAGTPFAAALNAAHTPPMMTAVRVVVVRDVGNLAAAEVSALKAYLADPTPTTELVLVAGGTVRKASATIGALEKLVGADGDVVGPKSEKSTDVLQRELDDAGLSLSAAAAKLLIAHVGGDVGLIPGLVETLAAVHGAGAQLDVDEVAPYLGEAGAIPMWDLTNAIERGDIPEAMAVVQRLLTTTSPSQPKPLHPLEVMGFLHGHYRRLLRLDDPEIRGNDAAAAALGGRMNPRAAGFRLRQARALGTDGLRQAFDHLSRADLDLKGDRAIPGDAVMAVLVARLAALTTRAAARRT